MKFKILLTLLFPTVFWAQTKIYGVIVASNQTQEQVIITNLETKDSVISNGLGKFVIQASVNDSIKFSKSGYLPKIWIVSSKEIQAEITLIELATIVTQLEEIVVDGTKKINAVSLGIINKPAKEYTKTERRLQTAGDFKPIHLLNLLGGNLPFDPIINKISGRTKMLKETINIEAKNSLFEKLKETYDSYLTEVIKVEDEEQRNTFYNYLIELEDIESLVFTKNIERNRFYIYSLYKNRI